MQDPYRNSNRDSRAKIQRLPKMYDGDPVEDFEWHDKGSIEVTNGGANIVF